MPALFPKTPVDDPSGFDLERFDPEQWDDLDALEGSIPDSAPSLPIILVSVAAGIAGGISTLYVTFVLLAWRVEVSAGVATLAMLLSLGFTSTLLSVAIGSRAILPNMAFGCGLLVLVTLFFGLCIFIGAVSAALLLSL